jgi:predicted AAA+ superfamily ATPase
MIHNMNKRNITSRILTALTDTPAVFLRGARQTGKTTLVKGLADDGSRTYVTMDTITALSAATEDPAGFVRALPKPVIIDEVQRAPGLFLAIKENIDRERQPGKYLLTGSANILALPGVADSLAGRMEVLTLNPLSQGEIANVQDDFIAALFAAKFPSTIHSIKPWPKGKLLSAMCAGGYPEVLSRSQAARRSAWFESYLTTLVERDVRDIANIQDRAALTRLARLIAARSGTLHNIADMGRNIGLNGTTLARYLAVLEALFLLWYLPAWSTNLGKRLMKSPKPHMTDSGFACYLCGADDKRLRDDPVLAGRLFESFIASEIQRQATWSDHDVTLYHYRSQGGDEVDLLLEDRAGNVAAVEIKLSESLTPRDAKGIAQVRDALGGKFKHGAVLYSGSQIVPLGERIFAVPASLLSGVCNGPAPSPAASNRCWRWGAP